MTAVVEAQDLEARYPLYHRSRGRLIAVVAVLVAISMVTGLDTQIQRPMFTTIAADLHAHTAAAFILTAGTITSVGLIPVFGHLADRVGQKRLVLACLAVFALGSLLAGFAADLPMLLAAEFVQGIGAAGLTGATGAVIAALVPLKQRQSWNSALGVSLVASVALGPVLGSFFLAGPGWRWGFLWNIPAAALACLLVALLLPRLSPARADDGFDVGGSAALFLGFGALTAGLSSGSTVGGFAGGVAAAACLAWFIVAERLATQRRDAVLIPLALFRKRNFSLTAASGVLLYSTYIVVFAFITFDLQMVDGVPTAMIGVIGGVSACADAGANVLAGRIISKTGDTRVLPALGYVLLVAGLAGLAFLSPLGWQWVLACSLVIDFGGAAALASQNTVLQHAAPDALVNTATSTGQFLRSVGSGISTAALTGVFAVGIAALPQGVGSFTPVRLAHAGEASRQAVSAGFDGVLSPIFIAMAAIAAGALVLHLFTRRVDLDGR